jgi:NADPH-dependent 2,4-dienoyl-CoA reductase/sulfur reductase-like enzyme
VAGLGVVRPAASNQRISGHRFESLLSIGGDGRTGVRDLRLRIRRRSVVSGDITSSTGYDMKIVIIGGTGLIGSQVAQNLRARGHDRLVALILRVAGSGNVVVLMPAFWQ